MPDRLAISLGGLVGLTVMGCALAWALRPRRPGRTSRLTVPSDPGRQVEAPYVPPHDDAP